MDTDLSADNERGEWDEVWRNRPLRQLVGPVQIDVAPGPNHTFGNVTHVDIAADPLQYIDSGWRKGDICPVCGAATSIDSRIAVSIYPLKVVFHMAWALGLINRALLRAKKSPAPPRFLGDAPSNKPLQLTAR